MNEFFLCPDSDWSSYKSNEDVTSFIYESLTPLVNTGKFNYMNLNSNTGAFENEIGSIIFMEFFGNNKETLSKILISLNTTEPEKTELFSNFISTLENKYNLKRVEC